MVAGTGEKTYQGKKGYPINVDASVDEIGPPTSMVWLFPGRLRPG